MCRRLNRNFEGRVARFADALNDETRTMHTEIDVENANGTLVEGMYAEARLSSTENKDALTAPIQAVERNGSGASVLIVDSQGQIQERPVKLGAEGSDRVEMLSGLAENDRVVIGSRSDFGPGTKCNPKSLPMAPASRRQALMSALPSSTRISSLSCA